MGKVDYNQIYNLQGQINSHQSSINSATSTISSIDEKLKRLRSAKRSVVSIQQQINVNKFKMVGKKLQTGSNWEGETRDKHNKRMDDFLSDFENFQKELNSYYDRICDEITRLENQKNDQNGIIGWCQNQINNLGNAIEKLLHTKEG